MSKFGEENLPELLEFTMQRATEYLKQVNELPVAARATLPELKAAIQKKLNDESIPAKQVIQELVQDTKDGLNNSTGPRFFGWVVGGNLPASLAADWLTSTWDQNSALYAVSPSAAVVEETVGGWMKEILHLPATASFAMVSGCQMAHVTSLATARHELLARRNYDIEEQGLYGAPAIRILCNRHKHGSIDRAVRFLGMGSKHIELIDVDDNKGGIVVKESLIAALEREPNTPTVVVLQAGDISTGAFDDFEQLIPIAHAHKAWVHIDGAFGLWAAASSKYRHLTAGVAAADSWATDGHKWMNVAFDCGYVFTAYPDAHRATVSHRAVYLTHVEAARDQIDWNPDWSRRSRGFASYAALRTLGKQGYEELINECCRCTQLLTDGIGKMPQTQIVTAPIINQAQIRFLSPKMEATEEDHNAFTVAVIEEICRSGEAFFSPSVWAGKKVMRISVCNYRTTEKDCERVLKGIEMSLMKLLVNYQEFIAPVANEDQI